ncbi:uncharacterized protein LOC133326510 [Musca vetustissima]|uniref:uncharacterized protein LOC133326510 n=1 Tax=Musca vetustissima TaxID=27455 RepID=UPI002AB5FB12|nr:uncharacterized protein LOC133326510 [Musca vetustissima]
MRRCTTLRSHRNWNPGFVADCSTNNPAVSARIQWSPSSTTASTPSSFPSSSTATSVSTSGRASYSVSSSSSSAASSPASFPLSRTPTSSNAGSSTSYSTSDSRTTASTPSSSPSSSSTTSAHTGSEVSYSTSFSSYSTASTPSSHSSSRIHSSVPTSTPSSHPIPTTNAQNFPSRQQRYRQVFRSPNNSTRLPPQQQSMQGSDPNTSFLIIQFNCNGLRNKVIEITNFRHENNILIAALQETKLTSSCSLSSSGNKISFGETEIETMAGDSHS